MSTLHRFTSRRVRFVTALMLIAIIGSAFNAMPYAANAQPMCPTDKIWSEEEQTCIELELDEEEPAEEPTVEPTATNEATEEPTETPADEPAETPAEEPAMESDEAETGDDSDAEATPGMDPNASFFLADWWEDLFGFEGSPAGPGLYVRDVLCDQVVSASDPIEEIIPNCRSMPSGTRDFDYDVFFNGTYTLSLPAYAYGSWTGSVPAGDLRIVSRYSMSAENYRTPFASCSGYIDNEDRTLAFDMSPQQLPRSGDHVLTGIPGNLAIYCAFFYIPILETEVTVDLIAYNCPQSVVDRNVTQYRDLVLECGVPSEAIEMQVLTSDGLRTGFTDFGLASFIGYTSGTFQVKEIVPEGYGVPYVFCIVMGPDGQTFKSRDMELFGNQYYVTVSDVPPGASVLCEFFNLPGEHPEPASEPPVTWRKAVD
jgi:hypothetical protein